jgi:phospholipase DDHD1
LQRGYGAYQVPGEDLETQLGSVPQHLIFIVHGIGEALFSREDVSTPSMIDSTNVLRMDLQRKQLEQYQKQQQQQQKSSSTTIPPPGRVEVIPIEWYNHIHDSSSSLMKSLNATTLTTIPALRAIANDVVFDVLMYMTPAFCESVLRAVTQQIQQFYDIFRKIHPEFHGTVTLMGHSLGSVICWDLLALLQQKQQQQNNTTTPTLKTSPGPTGYEVYAQKEHADTAQNGSWGPPIANYTDFPTLPFTPQHTIFLGSPLGIFLTLRGAHAVFESLRNSSSSSPVSSFTLPTQSVFNIFHPSDPVAYRIEPLVSTFIQGCNRP